MDLLLSLLGKPTRNPGRWKIKLNIWHWKRNGSLHSHSHIEISHCHLWLATGKATCEWQVDALILAPKINCLGGDPKNSEHLRWKVMEKPSSSCRSLAQINSNDPKLGLWAPKKMTPQVSVVWWSFRSQPKRQNGIQPPKVTPPSTIHYLGTFGGRISWQKFHLRTSLLCLGVTWHCTFSHSLMPQKVWFHLEKWWYGCLKSLVTYPTSGYFNGENDD